MAILPTHAAEPTEAADAVIDQLRLSTEARTLPYLWIPNGDGTLSKVHTETGKELARYRTCPAGADGEPSRATVDLEGNCWVANRRTGTVLKIGLPEQGACIGRNGNAML